MADIQEGRWTADIQGDFVVFLIGARVGWRNPIRSVLDLGGRRSMGHMLAHLARQPDKGLLAYERHGLLTIQYWRSFAHLEAFASSSDDPHAQVWRDYWRRVGRSGRTGIWHETFLVRDGEYEAVYGNMPVIGLAKASRSLPIAQASTARRRLRGTAED